MQVEFNYICELSVSPCPSVLVCTHLCYLVCVHRSSMLHPWETGRRSLTSLLTLDSSLAMNQKYVRMQRALELCTLHCTPHTLRCTPHTLHCAPHTVHCAPHTLHCTPHTLYCTPHNLRCTPHTLHCTPHTLHCTPHTLHCAPHTLHCTPSVLLCTLHLAPCTWHYQQFILSVAVQLHLPIVLCLPSAISHFLSPLSLTPLRPWWMLMQTQWWSLERHLHMMDCLILALKTSQIGSKRWCLSCYSTDSLLLLMRYTHFIANSLGSSSCARSWEPKCMQNRSLRQFIVITREANRIRMHYIWMCQM